MSRQSIGIMLAVVAGFLMVGAAMWCLGEQQADLEATTTFMPLQVEASIEAGAEADAIGAIVSP